MEITYHCYVICKDTNLVTDSVREDLKKEALETLLMYMDRTILRGHHPVLQVSKHTNP
jgi:hypothetical protein